MPVIFLSLFLEAWRKKKKRHVVILCKMMLQHTANYYIDIYDCMSEDKEISWRLWPASTPGLKNCNF
jgi:hypothetical protein